jgi:hypothetical protein
MLTAGHINLSQFNDWYKHLLYQRIHVKHGYNLVDPRDDERYNLKSIDFGIARDFGADLQNFLNEQFSWLDQKVYAVHQLIPGTVLPWHTDTYFVFKTNKGISDSNHITRVIVFLEDWQKGHISETGNKVNTGYKAGDWISWVGETPHMVANLGHTDRYTLQITGIRK